MRDRIVTIARSFSDVPFVFHGRDPKEGLDCWGLIRITCDRLGLLSGCDASYSKMSDTRNLFTKMLPRYGAIPIAIVNAQPGDVVLLCDYNHRELVHCGFLAARRSGEKTLIHASVRTGKVIEVSFSGIYQRIAFAAYRLPGVE